MELGLGLRRRGLRDHHTKVYCVSHWEQVSRTRIQGAITSVPFLARVEFAQHYGNSYLSTRSLPSGPS
jgi:hypothetical protein